MITDAHEGLKAAIRRVFGGELAALPRAPSVRIPTQSGQGIPI